MLIIKFLSKRCCTFLYRGTFKAREIDEREWLVDIIWNICDSTLVEWNRNWTRNKEGFATRIEILLLLFCRTKFLRIWIRGACVKEIFQLSYLTFDIEYFIPELSIFLFLPWRLKIFLKFRISCFYPFLSFKNFNSMFFKFQHQSSLFSTEVLFVTEVIPKIFFIDNSRNNIGKFSLKSLIFFATLHEKLYNKFDKI